MNESMTSWMAVAAVALLGSIAAPLLMRRRKQDPAIAEQRRAKQRAVLADLDRAIAPLVDSTSAEPMRVGPGSPVYDAYMEVRTRIRYDFRSSTGIRFDRELGYLLNRPDTIRPATPQLLESVRQARAVLLEEIEG
jgi:hypothetical protein